jgi:predicted metalloprotease with PDZ domain
MGLRELLMKLSKEYGKKRAFSEANFFDQLVAMTYPEIGDFINRYIKGAERLPVREYFASLGIDYKETGEADSSKGSLRLGMRPVDSLIVVSMVYEDSKCGLIKGDVVEKIGGTPLTFENAQMLFSKMVAQRAGSSIPITIKRGGKEMEVQSILEPRVSRHLFTVTPEPSPEQIKMRDVWMSNM